MFGLAPWLPATAIACCAANPTPLPVCSRAFPPLARWGRSTIASPHRVQPVSRKYEKIVCKSKGGEDCWPLKRRSDKRGQGGIIVNKNIVIAVLGVLVIVLAGYAAVLRSAPSPEPSDGPAPSDRADEPLAPIPETAKGPAIDQEKGYLVEEIEDGLYYITEGTYQVMFLTTGEGVIIVDAPPSIGENILKAVAEVTEEPITHVIYSHSHADHIAAAGIYPDEATFIAHEDTLSQLERTGSSEIPFGTFVGGSPVPLPTETFSEDFTLQVGSQTLELAYEGPNHEAGNIFVYAPGQKVLMVVDVIFPGWTPFKDIAVAEDVPGFIKAHDDVLAYDFETFIGGHLTRLGDKEDVETQKEYILDIQANATKALQSVDFTEIAEDVGFENPWQLFGTYLDAVEDECVDSTVPDWTGKLAGVDVFTGSHCAKIIESLRID